MRHQEDELTPRIQNAPSPDDLSLALRGFLIRLTALDGQLLDCKGAVLT